MNVSQNQQYLKKIQQYLEQSNEQNLEESNKKEDKTYKDKKYELDKLILSISKEKIQDDLTNDEYGTYIIDQKTQHQYTTLKKNKKDIYVRVFIIIIYILIFIGFLLI